MTPEDPRLTAYALNELTAAQHKEVERELEAQPVLYGEVNDIMGLGSLLTEFLSKHPLSVPRDRITPIPLNRIGLKQDSRWKLASAAIFATAACVTAVFYGMSVWVPDQSSAVVYGTRAADKGLMAGAAITVLSAESAYAGEMELEAPYLSDALSSASATNDLANAGNLGQGVINLSRENHLSESSVATAATAPPAPEAEAKLSAQGPEQGQVPGKLVQVDQLVTAFPYNDGRDLNHRRIAAGMRLTPCPWDKESLLLGIVLKNTSKTKDLELKAKLQVDSDKIGGYKILGPAQDAVTEVTSPRTLRAGESHFVIYELQQKPGADISDKTQLATLKVNTRRPKLSWDSSVVVSEGSDRSWLSSSEDIRFAAMMASFGEALRLDGRNLADSEINSDVSVHSSVGMRPPHGRRDGAESSEATGDSAK